MRFKILPIMMGTLLAALFFNKLTPKAKSEITSEVNPPRENLLYLQNLKEAHYFEEVLDNYQQGSIPYEPISTVIYSNIS